MGKYRIKKQKGGNHISGENNNNKEDHKMPEQPSNIPIPDPSVLTTQQLTREISAIQALTDTKFIGLQEQFRLLQALLMDKIQDAANTRHEALEKISQTIQDGIDKTQQEARFALGENEKRVNDKFNSQSNITSEKVIHLELLHDEKFASIQNQFTERDTRTEQTSRDSKVAVDAALQAAKEAVGEQNKSNALAIAKSEAAFTKQIDQISTLIQTTVKGVDDKIDDIKTRLTLIEGNTVGRTENHQESQSNKQTSQSSNSLILSVVFGIGGLVIGIGGFVVAIMSHGH